GNDSFCISAFQGLEAAAFDGPISVLNQCVTDSSRQALGDALEGVYLASVMPLGDTEDPGLAQWAAIVDEYGDGEIDLSNSMGPTIYLTMMAMREALDGITGDITSATIIETIKAAPAKPLPAGGGLT
nr:hypothetical protein [Micromonospora sp. DSM 115978]